MEILKRNINLEFSSIEEELRLLYSGSQKILSRINTKKFIFGYLKVNLKYNTEDKDKIRKSS